MSSLYVSMRFYKQNIDLCTDCRYSWCYSIFGRCSYGVISSTCFQRDKVTYQGNLEYSILPLQFSNVFFDDRIRSPKNEIHHSNTLY